MQELYSEAYKARCIKRLKEWGAPVEGWVCVNVIDVVGDDEGFVDAEFFTCELCDCPKVRYVHVMQHVDYFELVSVGCICAGIMEGDILAAKEREKDMKNRAKRKTNYLKREWRWRANGNRTMRYKGRWLTIMPSQYSNGGYGVVFDGKSVWNHNGKRMTEFLTAVHAAFDIVDPPIGGRRL